MNKPTRIDDGIFLAYMRLQLVLLNKMFANGTPLPQNKKELRNMVAEYALSEVMYSRLGDGGP